MAKALLGEDCPAFDPHHVWGQDKGTRACPMCKYGKQQGVMAWINTDEFSNVTKLTKALEAEIKQKGTSRMRAFIIYMNPEGRKEDEVERMLKDFAEKAQLRYVAVTYVPTPTDVATANLYDINPDQKIKNTLIIYKSYAVFDKFINFSAGDEDLKKLIKSVERAEAAKSF